MSAFIFLIQPTFWCKDRNLDCFHWFSGELKTPQFPSELSWPVICVMACQTDPCEGWWLANMKKGILGLLHSRNMPIIVETIFVNFLFSSSLNFEPSGFWMILPIKALVLFTCKVGIFARYTVGNKLGTYELLVVT